jgi:hypothetical protein
VSSGNIEVQIPGSDDPLGVFTVQCPSAASDVTEDDDGSVTSSLVSRNITMIVDRGGVERSTFAFVVDLIFSRPLGTDFTAQPTVHFAAGQAQATVVVGVLADTTPEGIESLTLTLSSPRPDTGVDVPNSAITPTARVDSAAESCTVTVLENDDFYGSFSIVPFQGGALDNNVAVAQNHLTVVRSVSTNGSVDVYFDVSGSATVGASAVPQSFMSNYSGATTPTEISVSSGVVMIDWVTVPFVEATVVVGVPSQGDLQLYEYVSPTPPLLLYGDGSLLS